MTVKSISLGCMRDIGWYIWALDWTVKNSPQLNEKQGVVYLSLHALVGWTHRVPAAHCQRWTALRTNIIQFSEAAIRN